MAAILTDEGPAGQAEAELTARGGKGRDDVLNRDRPYYLLDGHGGGPR
jgi:hypothetical protein